MVGARRSSGKILLCNGFLRSSFLTLGHSFQNAKNILRWLSVHFPSSCSFPVFCFPSSTGMSLAVVKDLLLSLPPLSVPRTSQVLIPESWCHQQVTRWGRACAWLFRGGMHDVRLTQGYDFTIGNKLRMGRQTVVFMKWKSE